MKSKINLLHLIITLLLVGIFTLNTQGQTIKGTWFTKFEVNSVPRRLILHIDSIQTGFRMIMDSPDAGRVGAPNNSFTFTFPYVRFQTQGDVFEGIVNRGFSKITGLYKSGDANLQINFTHDSIAPDDQSMISIRNRYKKQEVYITMRDGVKLFTSIYTPKDSTKTYPMLMMRTPYNSEPGGKDSYSRSLMTYYRFVKENYIMVFQDVRGKYMSEGKFEDIRAFNANKKTNKDIDEASDTYDAVDWLVKNVKYNNGNLGVMGISYPGFYSTMAILSGHPAVKAVSPQAPVTAWFKGDDEHHNGAFFVMDNFSFDFSNARTFKAPSRQGFMGFRYPVNDNYQFYLEMGALKNFAPKYFTDTIQIWNDDMNHPNYDSFWQDRDPTKYLTNVKPAVMTVGGWFDAEDLYGTLHTYRSLEKLSPGTHPNFLVMGPWSHGQWRTGPTENLGNIYWGQDAAKPYHEMEVNFFDYYLRGKGNGGFAKATIFVTGANEWRRYDAWPPKNTTTQKIYFQPSGKLAFSVPTVAKSFDEYVADPMKPVPYSEKVQTQRTREYMTDDQRFASRRPDVMVYQTDVLTEDMTLTGPLTADLFVSTTGTDADYVVKLIDVFPQDMVSPAVKMPEVAMGGYQMLVRGEVFRGRFRNSFEKPEAFKPNKVTEVKYELPDVAHLFRKGHRIMIQVQNSWFPLVDRNPQKFVDIYKCNDDDFQKATDRIYHDEKWASCLEVTVLK